MVGEGIKALIPLHLSDDLLSLYSLAILQSGGARSLFLWMQAPAPQVGGGAISVIAHFGEVPKELWVI